MKFATIGNGTPDGSLVIVSRDLQKMVTADAIAPTLQNALENWDRVEPALRDLADALEAGTTYGIDTFDASRARAPLPRAWQWLDGSVYRTHDRLMAELFKIPSPALSFPMMYQGLSDRFLAPTADVPMPSEDDGIDFEGEFGVITDSVPAGTDADEAARHIRLLVLINDWSLRRFAPIEKPVGFGWIRAKPACSIAPVAVTPDEIGEHWRDARVHLNLDVWSNGERFGAANGGPMVFSFAQLVAHAAYNRDLVAGTIIGSGTVSNENYTEVGSSCIAERRAIEAIHHGGPITPFMRFGDRVRMSASLPNGADVFGSIDQRVVASA